MTEEEFKKLLGRGKDLRGKKSGMLTPLYPLKERKNKNIVWHCLCDCSNECDVNARHLDGKHTCSCGCLQKKHAIQHCKKRKINLLGQTFGQLTVIAETEQRKYGGQIVWECKCNCGNICYVSSSNLITGGTKSCGCTKSHGEQKIKDILQQNNIIFETQKTFKTCCFPNTKMFAFFDFYLPEYNLLIKYDGIQHFKATNKGWNTEENYFKTKQRDEYKNNWCKENNIPLIRIPYTHLNNLCLNDLLLETSHFLISQKKGGAKKQ